MTIAGKNYGSSGTFSWLYIKKRRLPRTFTPEFKQQLVKFYENGKSGSDNAREYDITYSALERWITNNKETESFKASYN